MNNKKYNIEFNYYYQLFNNFKTKECDLINNIIKGSPRMNEYMRFESYANVSFDEDDKLHKIGHVTLSDGYERKKTNCMVFNLPESQFNHNRYNKLFLYTHSTTSTTYYGYLLLNTKTGRHTQIADVSGEINDIIVHMNKTIVGFNTSDKFEKQLKDKIANNL
ncbi:MAG: hypothetical protein J6D03_09720 [Clostridia bacterium]|nr:hypothetical protein [Clostridia bacterium]